VCIVTGAAQGIGAACARAVAREGGDVAIIDLKHIDQAGPVNAEVDALGRRALVIEADMSDSRRRA
jgi:NAD(P)-dependent dehydrogenase (short-subunit alcohol dehydrogenase family)